MAATVPGDECSRHTVRARETLSAIAAARLGSARRWPEIAAANRAVAGDPKRLPVDAELVMPCGPGGTAAETAAPATAAKRANAPEKAAGIAADTRKALERTGAGSADGPKTAEKPAAAKRTPASDDAGTETKPKGAAAKPKAAADPEPKPAAEPGPKPKPPAPVWTVARGEWLSDVLRRWGKRAGWTVLAGERPTAWQIGVPVRIQAPFDEAVEQLATGLGHGGPSPRITLHPNRVIRLGSAP